MGSILSEALGLGSATGFYPKPQCFQSHTSQPQRSVRPLCWAHQTKPWKASTAEHIPRVLLFSSFYKCGMGSNNNYGKMWLICRRHSGVCVRVCAFSDLLFLFSIHSSLLENSSLSLQTLVITNKSTDSSPAETMIMMESRTYVCVCLHQSGADVDGCREMCGGQ